MKNRFVLLFLLIFFIQSNFVNAQKIAGIELKTIEEMVKDSNSIYYYPKLVERFNRLDTSLRNIDYLMLYYGYSTTKAYHPYKHFAYEDSLVNLNEKNKNKESIELANLLLKENPISLFGNVQKGIALFEQDKKKEAGFYLEKYRLLVAALESSGEGSSYENPIVLTTPKDAEAIILRYKLSTLSKTLNGNQGRYYDVYLVKNEEGKEYPIYFDITIPQTIGMQKLKEDMKK